MTTHYRHRRTNTPATPFPALIEPGEIVVNTANRQIVVGDANAATMGQPVPLLAVRIFDTRAIYALNDAVLYQGTIYKCTNPTGPGAFNPVNWATPTVDTSTLVAKAGDTMTGPLVLPADPTLPLQSATKQYADAGDTATKAYADTGDAAGKAYTDAAIGAMPPPPPSLLISDTPPVGAPDKALWWESDSGLLYVRYNDGNSTQWVIACPQPDLNTYLLKTGDTMSGSLAISTANASLILNKSAANQSDIILGRVNNKSLWSMELGTSNPQQDFLLNYYDDSGNYITYALYASRVTGLMTVVGDPTVALGVATKQYVDGKSGGGLRTRTVFSIVGSGTYTTPANCKAINVRMVGGGGGGAGSGTGATAGTSGGDTTFGASLIAHGGPGGGPIAAGAPGGVATGGDFNIQGGSAGGSINIAADAGGHGGVSFFGGGGGQTASGNSGQPGSAFGSGGGGGASAPNNWSAAGGGAGGYLEKLYAPPAATYSYVVGAPGNAGGGNYNGGAGFGGFIIIDEYY